MILLKSNGSYFGDKVFACIGGTRRHVLDKETLEDYEKMTLSDVVEVSDDILKSFNNAGWLPKKKFISINSITTTKLARDFITKFIKGSGIEFGAGSAPFPTNPDVNVTYADIKDSKELMETFYDKSDLVNVTCISDVVSEKLPSEYFDFCILCHVIEHVPSPFHVLKNIHRILKNNGVCVLVIPDKNKTFDQKRFLTPIEHLINDYENYQRENDLGHYMDFYKNVHLLQGSELEKKVILEYENYGDIHYHTFDSVEFNKIVDYALVNNIAPFKQSKIYDFNTTDSNEFYCVLTKTYD